MQKLPYKLKKGCIIHHGQHNCFGFPLDQKSLFKRILCLQKWCILKTDKMQDALDAQWVGNISKEVCLIHYTYTHANLQYLTKLS